MSVGLDLGTANLLVARQSGQGVEVKRLRNSFVEIDDEQRQRLSSSTLNAVHLGNKSFIVGDEAISLARILNKEVRRPMSAGVLNPEERDGRMVISTLIKTLVGEPKEEFEKCAFSVPSLPVDNASKSGTVWHTGFFNQLLEGLGYDPEPVNEALAIIYSECANDDHCGIAISHGAGQVNVAASYKLIASIEFSVARSGDWIDANCAAAVGTSIAKVLKIKEDPAFDLRNPEALDDEIGSAIMYHYKAMIKHELTYLSREWIKMKAQLDFPNAIPIVLSGGTASLKGFKELWIEELDRFHKRSPLPFKVSEVRLAKDCMGAVARGLLVYALSV